MLASGASSQGRSQLLPRLTSANSSRMTLGAGLAPAAVRMSVWYAVRMVHEGTLGPFWRLGSRGCHLMVYNLTYLQDVQS